MDNIRTNTDLLFSFFKSILIHGLIIFLGIFFKTHFLDQNSSKSIKFLNPTIKMLQSSVRVDILALPKDTLKELQQKTIEEAPKSEAKTTIERKTDSKKVEENVETETGNELKKFEKKKDFLSRLKEFSRPTTEGKQNKTDSKSSLLEKWKNASVLYGNKLAQGNSVTGRNNGEFQGIYAQYVSTIPSKVKPFWKLPSYLMGRDLRCRVRVFIAQNGEVLNATIYESSGVKEFDDKAIESVFLSSPFSTPDQNIIKNLANGEVILGFPL